MRTAIAWSAAAALAAMTGIASAGQAELETAAAQCAAALDGEVVLAAPAGETIAEIAALEGRVQIAGASGWTDAAAGGTLGANDQLVLDGDGRAELHGAMGTVTVSGPALLSVAIAGEHGCVLREDTRLLAQEDGGPNDLPDWVLPAVGGAALIGIIAAVASSGSGDDAPPSRPVSP